MIKISLPVKLAIQNAKNHGCKTVGEALKFIESDPGYENWVADDVMTTVQQVYGPNCSLDAVSGISAFSDIEMEGKGDGQGQEEGAEGEGDGEDGGKCATCGKKKKGGKSGKSDKKGEDSPGNGDKKPGDKSGKGSDAGEGSEGDGDGEGDGDDSDGEGAGDGDSDGEGEGEGDPSDDSGGSGDGDSDGEGECEGHDGEGDGDDDGDGDGNRDRKGQGDGKGDGRPKDGPGKPSGSGAGNWLQRFGKQWFTKDVLDSPFITRDFDGLAKEAREWKPNKTVGDRVNACLSQIADLGGDTDDEPDRYHIGKLVTRISTRQGGLQSHCRRNERGRRKVLLLPDISGSCVAFSASALEFCYSAAMVDERIVVIETFDGQIRMPGEHWDAREDGGRDAHKKRKAAPFPFTKKYYEEKLFVGNEDMAVEREKNFINWVMNGDFCAVIALGDTQGGWLYRALDVAGMKVFWMDPGSYGFVNKLVTQQGAQHQRKTISLGRYAPLPRGADGRYVEGSRHDPRDWYHGGGNPDDISELTRYKNVSYSVNMSHDVEGFIEALGVIIREY